FFTYVTPLGSSTASALGNIMPLPVQMGKKGHQRGEAIGCALPLGQQMVARFQGRERLWKRLLANGILPRDGIQLNSRQLLQLGVAVQHPVGLAPGAIEQQKTDSASRLSRLPLSHLGKGDGLLIRP